MPITCTAAAYMDTCGQTHQETHIHNASVSMHSSQENTSGTFNDQCSLTFCDIIERNKNMSVVRRKLKNCHLIIPCASRPKSPAGKQKYSANSLPKSATRNLGGKEHPSVHPQYDVLGEIADHSCVRLSNIRVCKDLFEPPIISPRAKIGLASYVSDSSLIALKMLSAPVRSPAHTVGHHPSPSLYHRQPRENAHNDALSQSYSRSQGIINRNIEALHKYNATRNMYVMREPTFFTNRASNSFLAKYAAPKINSECPLEEDNAQPANKCCSSVVITHAPLSNSDAPLPYSQHST